MSATPNGKSYNVYIFCLIGGRLRDSGVNIRHSGTHALVGGQASGGAEVVGRRSLPSHILLRDGERVASCLGSDGCLFFPR